MNSFADILCGGILLISLALPVFLRSRLLKIEHDHFHDQWEKDGRPYGMPFWLPLDELTTPSLRSSLWTSSSAWLFKTPQWIKEHPEAINLLKYYRLISFLLYGGLSIACLLLLLFSPRSTQ